MLKSHICCGHFIHLPLHADRAGRWAERSNAERQNGWQIDGEVHSVSQTDEMLEKQAVKLIEKGGTA